MKNIGNKMAKGAAWMVLFKFTERGLGLISTIILARLLVPTDFGLIAMAMSMIALLELLSAFSFDVILIQKQNAERRHYDTAWTFNVLFAVGSAITLLALAIPAANFYNEPRLEFLIYVLALGTLIKGFENIGIVAFRKEMQFNKEFKFQVTKKLAGFFVTIPLALTFQSYWALVAGMLTSWCTGVIMSYVLHSYRPRFSLTAGRELFHFSKWLMLNNILFFLKIRFADYVIGKTSGPKQLGLFSVAYEISNLPTTELVAPINRAIFPGYAKIATDMEVLRQGFINVISLIVLVATPIGVGIAVTAEPLIEVFLGSKWLDAIPLVQILAIYGVTVAMQTNLAAVYLALGIPKVLTLLSAAHVALLIPLVIWLTGSDGAIGAAWAYLIISTLFIPINYSVMFRRIQLKPMTLIANFWRSLTSSIIMYAVVYFYLDYTHNPAGGFGNDLFRLISSAGIGAAVYIACVLGLWRASRKPGGAEATALDFVLPKIKAKMGYTQ